MIEITKDTIIGDLLNEVPEAAPLLLQMGMHCLHCPASRGESIGEACEVHGVDSKPLLDKINALI